MFRRRSGIMASAQVCAQAFGAKKQPQGCFSLRFEVPWIAKNKLVDQTRN
jgi:hypothetical protein